MNKNNHKHKHICTTFESFKMLEDRDEEYFDYKETQSKGEITKVTAMELEQATARSRMYIDTLNSLDEYARLYDKCDRMSKELANKKSQAKDNILAEMDNIFDTIDGTATRVIETQNILLTISKHDPERMDLVPDYQAALSYIKDNYADLNTVIDEALEATMKTKSAPAARISNISLKRRTRGMRNYDDVDDMDVTESKRGFNRITRNISEGVGEWIKELWTKVKRIFSKVDKNLESARNLVYGQ